MFFRKNEYNFKNHVYHTHLNLPLNIHSFKSAKLNLTTSGIVSELISGYSFMSVRKPFFVGQIANLLSLKLVPGPQFGKINNLSYNLRHKLF